LHNNKLFKKPKKSKTGQQLYTLTRKVDESTIKINLWDCNGNDKLRHEHAKLIRSAHACIIVFDLTSANGYQDVVNWFRLFKSNANEKCQCLILGNKNDLASKKIVKDEDIEKF
jgi:small GTP-binding protein